MFFARLFSVVAIFIAGIIGSAYPAEQKLPEAASEPASEMWAPVDESDWAVFMDAPAYHFDQAKEYLQKGETAKASSELRIGNSFLTYQRDRIAFAAKQIEELSKAVADGKEKNPATVDSITATALKVISNT